jgi:hypothetical protein
VLLAVPFGLGLSLAPVLGSVALLAVHAVVRRPRAAPRLVCRSDGRWAVPALGLAGLTLGRRTRYTTLWVRLSFVGPPRSLDIVLLADQVDPESWRKLQTHLRRGVAASPEPDRSHPRA